MDELRACCACLATNVKLHYIYENELKPAYESITGIDISDLANMPQHLCNYCVALLMKCVSFRERCLRSQYLLKYVMDQQVLTTDYIGTIDRDFHNISLPYTIQFCNNVVITKTDMDLTLKEELVLPDTDIVYKTDEFANSDEEPLSEKIDKEKEKVNSKYDDVDYDNSTNNSTNDDLDNADIFDDSTNVNMPASGNCMITLSKEEQLEEILARKNSYNYQSSVYKCDKCYKGFMTVGTYNNHMTRHDLSSGPEICGICQKRWPDVRSLRSHTLMSHERKYLCRLCDHTCKSGHKAREHQQWHKGHTFVCKICGASFDKSTSHLTHLRLRHPSEHSCSQCGHCFVSRTGLNMHQKMAHRIDEKSNVTSQLKCLLCNFKFRNIDALNKHITFSDNGICETNMCPCKICGDNFTTPELLKEHETTHKKETEVRCDECDKRFANERSFAIHHQRIHLGLRHKYSNPGIKNAAVVCEICGRKCTSKSTLMYHQRIHTGEKPYKCNECPKSFSILQRLQIHCRTHTGERPYKCSDCPKAFKHKAALNRHYLVHSGAKPYACAHCGRAFSQSNSMKMHVRTVHLKIPSPYRSRRKIND